MESSLPFSSLFFAVAWLVLLQGAREAQGNQNYTVGDSLGWYDKFENPKIDYQKWVAGKNFSLGDFLVFNTDRNHSVVQTYNSTTYKLCDVRNAEDDDTTVWSPAEDTLTGELVSIAVPLLKVGQTYFFSGFFAGKQCKHGQRFKIKVNYGQGLPESLRPPPPAAKAKAPSGEVSVTNPPADSSQPKIGPPGNMVPRGDPAAMAGCGGLLVAILWLVFMAF